jgi:hypothetical protein
MQMQSTYSLEKVLKMVSLYFKALLCTLQHIVIHAMQLSGVNSTNFSLNISLQVFHEKPVRLYPPTTSMYINRCRDERHG